MPDSVNEEPPFSNDLSADSVRLRNVLGSLALCKATYDQFDYAMKLVTGEEIRFSEATLIGDDWVHLGEARLDGGLQDGGRIFHRGIDVRISQIVWVLDALYGS